MKVEERDDMQLFEHKAPNGKIYQFRMIDSNITPCGNGGFSCRFPIFEKGKDELLCIVGFRLKSEEIDQALFKTYEKIDKFVLENEVK